MSVAARKVSGTISPLTITGGMAPSTNFSGSRFTVFPMTKVSSAAISEASVPNTMSIGLLKQLAIKHPIVRPAIASGMRRGRRVNASLTLICTAENEIGYRRRVIAA